MKNLKLGISALALTVASTVFAQTTSNPWLIGVGAHGVNHMAVNRTIGFKSLTNFEQIFQMNNYSITPPLSKLTVARNINKYMVVDWQTSVGNVENKRVNMGKEFFLMTGLGLQFKENSLWNENSWFDPYFRVGANYLRHDYSGLGFPRTDMNGKYYASYDKDGNMTGKADHFVVNGGIGSNFWLTKAFGVGIQGDYVVNPIDNKSDVVNFWQGSASLLFRFGNTDKDKDGILDKDDACPETPGLPEFQGCPDTDGDGIPDKDDECVDVAGPVENNGCPWPDTDEDGLVDKDDACPTVAGPVENDGCPWPDTDKDGILDKDDACPTVPGLAEYKGCPKPKDRTADEVTRELNNIFFNFGKATIRPESNSKLDAAAKILMTDGGTYVVEGQTDRKGSDVYNLNLSRLRAAAVVAALEARGVDTNSLKSRGVGEAKAQVDEKASDEARLIDRKVVVTPLDGSAFNSMDKSDVQVAPAKKATKKRK